LPAAPTEIFFGYQTQKSTGNAVGVAFRAFV
jgi:hypothetical protein